MKWVIGCLAVSGLCLTVVPAFLVFCGIMPFETHLQLMFWGMLFWFAAAVLRHYAVR